MASQDSRPEGPARSTPGAEVDGGGKANGAAGASIDECDSGEVYARSDPVTGESEHNNEPEGSILSKTGVAEVEDRSSRPSEVAQVPAVYSTAAVSGGEAFRFALGAEARSEANAQGSGVDKCIVLADVLILPCVARVEPGFGEVTGIRRRSVVA